mgnify:CR=1 FL=1
MTQIPIRTPWGEADRVQAVGPVTGHPIYLVPPQSHGGYYVQASVVAAIPTLFSQAALTEAIKMIVWREQEDAQRRERGFETTQAEEGTP